MDEKEGEMRFKTRGSHGWLSLTVGLALLAGCVSPAGVNETSGRQSTGVGATLNPAASNDGAAAQTPAIDNGEQTPLERGFVPPSLDAEGLAAVDKVPAVMVKASEGGKYVTEDGLLTAIIPPNALSQDAQVRFARLETSDAKNTNQLLAGIRFQMDIGDAYVKPGEKLMVTSKADDRLVSELRNMYPDFDAERFSLSQDEKGNWMVTMPINGPDIAPLDLSKSDADPFMTDRRGVMTEGAAPLPAGRGGNFKKDSRIEAFCDYAPPPPPKPVRDMVVDVRWESDDPSLDGQPAFDSNPDFNSYVRFGNLTSVQVTGVEGFWTREPVPAVPGTPERSHFEKVIGATSGGMRTDAGRTVPFGDTDFSWAEMQQIDDEFLFVDAASRTLTPQQARAVVEGKTFVSLGSTDELSVKVIDEPARAEQPATTRDVWNPGWINLSGGQNEDVRSGYEGGTRWVVHRDLIVQNTADQPVNAAGQATNRVRQTFTIGVQAYTNNPNPTPKSYPGAGIGSTAQRTITAGNNAVSVLVPKYSPLLGLDMRSPDLAVSGDLDVLLQIAGVGERSYSFTGNNSNAFNVDFRVRLPDDQPHNVTIKEIRARDGALYATQASLDSVNQNLRMQRNGVYRGLRIDLVPGAAK